ncbi:NACHT and WD repeat domain-containing protein 2 [Odontesthes bonariensis]|uniref:NACHT and WD repeat domain-containing protein 2 n=1 Tax=Odontesthes bonariensis TaxID=219752 RepID=UPI003F58F66A
MCSKGKDCSPSSSGCSSSCVKIYLCSNPDDSVVERRALRESVFPKFREHCRHSLGLDVRVIDPFESSDSSCWPDENTRQQLIEECRESSAGPFLLALAGHQYGTASLPTQVEVSEYQLLLQESQRGGASTQELEGSYQRDENSIPASYCLRPSHTHHCSPLAEESKVQDKEEELIRVFQTAASLCVHSGLMSSERAHCFHRSALDADLRFALGKSPVKDVVSRCVVYVHKVLNAKEDRGKRLLDLQQQPNSEAETSDQTTPRTAPTRGELLSELCNGFLPGLVTSCQLLLYTTTTECDPRHGYTTARRRSYTESLCQQVLSDLVMLTNSPEPRVDARIGDALSREQVEQEQLCSIFSQFYDVVQPEEEKVRAYVEQRDQQCPLVVTGGPCTGKTVLAAHCTQLIKSWLTDSDPVVISCFCHFSINTSPKRLLSNLCSQIACRYDHKYSSEQDPNFCLGSDSDDPSCIPNSREQINDCSPTSALTSPHESSTKDHVSNCNPNLSTIPCPDPRGLHSGIKADICLSELEEHLASLLTLLPSIKQPLVLILDGLDQLEHEFGAQIIRRLPSPLPPDVKLILTVASNRTQLLRDIQLHFPQGRRPHFVSEGSGKDAGYVCVQLGSVDRKQCVKMLASLLRSSGRRVTSGQQALVNRALTSCCLPLYARLLHAHTSLWHSDSDVTESSLPDAVHSSISALLDQLEQRHGSSVMARAASYLTLSRTGLAEAELADLLSRDNVNQAEYVCDSGDPDPKIRAMQVDVERLLLDLKSFLIKRTVADSQVLFWVSRHFKLVVAKRYLDSDKSRRKIHSEMADYFSGRQACGSWKPLLGNQSSELNIDADRQPDIQPFVFPSSKDKGRVNMRKVLELPHHLQQSGRLEELECGLLMSFGFHWAMVQAGLLGDLVGMLERDGGLSKFQFLREKLLLASTLKSSACFLRSSPLQLPTVMETSLLPYLEVFPALEGYIRDIRQESSKNGRGLGVAICPSAHSVPPIQCLKHDDKTREICVTETAGTECGVVAQVMEDGSAFIWRGSECEAVKLSLSHEQMELKFAGVKSSGQFLLLSAQRNKLFVWDVTGPERFLEVKDSMKIEFESNQTPNRIEGFVACQKKLCIWRKNESSVSVFDISSETLNHLRCQSCVTCLVFSFDSLSSYCGQEDGTVSIFDIKTSSLLGTFSNSRHNAITLIILCEDKWGVACVDSAGSVALWDVSDKTKVPRLVKETLNEGKSNNILSTDYSDEINTLLVCQAHQVTLWDTCNWELWDRFLAPHGRAFTQALLAHDGHLFLASFDTCTLVLVWRVSTGKCVLSLETNTQPHTLLKTTSDFICVSRDGCLTVWDSEMIVTAGTAPKMAGEVEQLVIEQSGKLFYTTDRSETVWRWRSDTGLPEACFLHGGPVDKLQLSPNSVHLVSLSAGDIYIWQTETGQNIVRISGSRATDILITPNSNFGVSISKQGLSRVWKMAHGGIVCSIHLYLSDAQVSPEGTFLIGLRGGDLLAASLWSGSISKRFSCVVNSERVIAFQTLSGHPDFVVVMAASGAVYTWKVSEETVCRHFHLPHMFHCQPQDFQMSPHGSYALLSTDNDSINLLDLSRVRLVSFKAEGPVIKACLDKGGRYVAHISHPATSEKTCACSLHAGPVLSVTRLSDGERIGSVSMFKNPSALVMSERQSVFVGFVDGSVGVYSVTDVSEKDLIRDKENFQGQLRQCPLDSAPIGWLPLAKPNVTWS